MQKPFAINSFYFIEIKPFLQSYKFTNKTDLLSALEGFQKHLGKRSLKANLRSLKAKNFTNIPF